MSAAIICLVASLVFSSRASAAPEYSPHVGQSYPNRVLFGDTHLHTAYSTDAGMLGNRLGPEAAYRFAMGEPVTSSTGVKARLSRPLDFLVVADHAENLGFPVQLAQGHPALQGNDFGKTMATYVKAGQLSEAFAFWSFARKGALLHGSPARFGGFQPHWPGVVAPLVLYRCAWVTCGGYGP